MRGFAFVAAAAALTTVSVAAPSPGHAQSWQARQTITRCMRGGYTCVHFRCEHVGSECVRLKTEMLSPHSSSRMTGHRIDGPWEWYGSSVITCDADGDHCVLQRR
jgi:hypothetical protein